MVKIKEKDYNLVKIWIYTVYSIEGVQCFGNPSPSGEALPISTYEILEIERSLDSLHSILGEGETWILDGGLAIPLNLGKFYRRHENIDISLKDTQLEEVVNNALAKRYELFSGTIKHDSYSDETLEPYEKISVDEAIKRKNLRLIKIYEVKHPH